MSHASIVRRDPFRSSPAWTDAPDVQFIWERTLNEVDECGVRCPQRKVTVEPGRRTKDGLSLRSAVAVLHEQRGSGAPRVGREVGTFPGTRELGHSFHVGTRSSTARLHYPAVDDRARV